MKVLYLECGMGASGDMLVSALSALLPDREAFISEINNALSAIGASVEISDRSSKGVTGLHTNVLINGVSEDSHDYGHDHIHNKAHGHSHDSSRDLQSISALIGGLKLPDTVKNNAKSIYGMIAEAESRVHGTNVETVHFHELGALDAVCDIVCVCMLMEMLSPDKVITSPVHVGSGSVMSSHGVIPVPAPAAAELLKGIPVYGGEISGELCTPTGAALLKRFSNEFGAMPHMMIQKTGYGIGTKDFPRCNCLRAFLGQTTDAVSCTNDQVVELSFHIDDMTPEAIGYASEIFRESGALDALLIPAQTKKNRPCCLLKVLCRPEDEQRLVRLIFAHTTTIGLRRAVMDRYTLARRTETVETEFGPVNVKFSEGFGIAKSKPEYEDMAFLADKTGLPLQKIYEIVLRSMTENSL